MEIRLLCVNDYNHGFFELLNTLTESPKPSYEEFKQHFDILQLFPFQTWVVENTETGDIVGTAKLIMEPKYTRGLSYVCHIEEVVIHPSMRSRGIGKRLIHFLLTRVKQIPSMYKVILTCKGSITPFYNSCGLSKEGVCMAYRN